MIPIPGLVGITNALYRMGKMLVSNDPESVKARGEIEATYKHNIEQPFMEGYNATPKEKTEWKAEREERKNRYGWIHVVFVLSALFFLFALLRFLWSMQR